MSTDEMHRQKVDLTIQVENAEKLLNALREKSRVRADKVIQFGKWLRDAPELNIYRQGHSIHCGQPLDQLHLLSDSDMEALQPIPSLEIANAIREQIATVADLKERLSRL
jgi:phage terminase large subunit-like protein